MTEPRWVEVDLAQAIHQFVLELNGGGIGVRDLGMLLSALNRPKDRYAYGQADVIEVAAAYAFGLARNHPFVDGNKRTALLVMALFLENNGLRLVASEAETTLAFLRLAGGEMDEGELAEWLRMGTEPIAE